MLNRAAHALRHLAEPGVHQLSQGQSTNPVTPDAGKLISSERPTVEQRLQRVLDDGVRVGTKAEIMFALQLCTDLRTFEPRSEEERIRCADILAELEAAISRTPSGPSLSASRDTPRFRPAKSTLPTGLCRRIREMIER